MLYLLKGDYIGIGFSVEAKVENQKERNMESELDTGFVS